MTSTKRGGRRGDSARGAAPDPHAARESARYDSPIASREHILATLAATKGPVDLERLGELLGTDGDEDATEALRRRVAAMQRDGQVVQNRKRGLVPVDDDALVAGRISAHKDGFGFLVTDDDDPDVFLNARQMRRVLHGDRVIASIVGTDRRGRREGRIVEVVERANATLVGRLVIEHGVAFLSPDSKKIHQDLMLGADALGGASHGDMVVGEIVEQPTDRQPPVGRIVEVLGQHLDAGMEIDVALRSAGIPDEWPEEVVEQARTIPDEVEEGAKVGRKDLRSVPLVTIDGADARDFDDAVWCERSGKGWRLIVAIADVAHYVEPDSPLDREAVNRGTSVYFPGRVVPMLPESLSNGLCSLNPDVDRLCMLADMTLDERGTPRRTRFHNGVMRSHARFTYDQVAEILEVPDSPLRAGHASLVPMLEDLHSLYGARAKARARRGAIEFESNETHIVFDENRKIEKLVPVERNDAHKLIEECMILANIAAATLLERFEVPALYRVHHGPKADRLEDLRAFLALRGLSLGGGESPSALDYAALAHDIRDRTDRHVIQTVMLRSMQQAVYTPRNEGHFGLALDEYAHFTSPIRRYPDLLVHRGIKHLIGRGTPATYRYSAADMQAFGEHCSMAERRAEEASRDVVSWLKCEYMLEHVGDEFAGTVASVTSFGLFVELDDSRVEGLIHITNLSHDYYRFDQAAHTLTGERTGRVYRLGDPMVVRVAAVNLDERKIDFQEVRHVPSERGDARAVDGEAEARRAAARRDRKAAKRETERLADAAMADAAMADAPAGDAAGEADADAVAKRPPRGAKRSARTGDEERASKGAGADAARAPDEPAGGVSPSPRPTAPDLPPEDLSAAKMPASDRPEPASERSEPSLPTPASRYEVGRRAPPQSTGWGSRPVSAQPGAVARTDAPADGPDAASDPASEAAPGDAGAGRTAAKKAASKRATAKRATTKKRATKDGAVEGATTEKAVSKRAATKKATAKKPAAGKTSGKKASGKKASAKKASGKKTGSKKAGAKRAAAGAATKRTGDGSGRDA